MSSFRSRIWSCVSVVKLIVNHMFDLISLTEGQQRGPSRPPSRTEVLNYSHQHSHPPVTSHHPPHQSPLSLYVLNPLLVSCPSRLSYNQLKLLSHILSFLSPPCWINLFFFHSFLLCYLTQLSRLHVLPSITPSPLVSHMILVSLSPSFCLHTVMI